jgi:hypothetical protein
VQLSGNRLIGGAVGTAVFSAALLCAAPALAALPPGYTVTRIDTPIAVAGAGFGNGVVNVGDSDGDGKDDIAATQYTGTEQTDAGRIMLFSGATGQLLAAVNAGDANVVGTGSVSADNFIARASDLGSCPNPVAQVANMPGPTCGSATVGPRDGVNEILLGAGGVEVNTPPVGVVNDVGRVYVLDGKTLNILKRIDMPVADRLLIKDRQNENPTNLANVRGGFGRTATNPRGLPPCAGNAGIGTCPTTTAIPTAVRVGDLTNDVNNYGDIVIGANFFPETGATAHPASQCAATAGASTCVGAGRAYVYRGEDIAGSSPAANLETPMWTLKNIGAQTDDPYSGSAGHVVENFGHSQFPVGDVGACQSGGSFPVVQPGDRCLRTSRTNVPDGKPEFVISTHRSECPLFAPDYSYFECGASILFDGATGAILYIYNHPEPQANALFGFTTGQHFAVGNLGDTALPDVVIPAMQNVGTTAEAGRGYVFSGNVAANMINFAFVDDPTPNTFGRFANPTEGAGDHMPNPQVGNELLVGQFSAVQTPNKADTNFDVSFYNAANETALQTISDPDAQPESGFGSRVFPMGDLNSDGFLDFGASSVRWDAPTAPTLDRGRVYIFRSDPNAVVPPPPPPPAGPAGPAGTAGPSGANGTPGPAGASTAAVVIAGRTVDLDASKETVKRNATIRLRGVVEAFANPAACEAGQTVQLQRRTVAGTRFTTFRTLTTSGTGTFQTPKFKVTSTQFYRARVAQTDSCAGDISPRVKVKVTRSGAAAARLRLPGDPGEAAVSGMTASGRRSGSRQRTVVEVGDAAVEHVADLHESGLSAPRWLSGR